MKTTDSPGAMLEMPLRGTAATGDSELSSTFQPVMSTGPAPVFVTSNQSAPTGLLPLDHGATSVTIRMPTGPATFPGEPISAESFAATKAPLTPTALSCEMVALSRPAVLSKVGNGPEGEAPKDTLARSTPPPSYRLTASPPVLRPAPDPL